MRNLSTDKPTPNRAASAAFRAAQGNKRPDAYFTNKGIAGAPSCVMGLSAEQVKKLGLSESEAPALLSPIVGRWGLQGAHLTFLTDDSLEVRNDQPQTHVGQLYGGWVKLAPRRSSRDKGTLVVTKSIVAAAALVELTGHSALATLTARNMARVTPPKASRIIIAPDNGKASVKAAHDLARRLSDLGCIVRIALLAGEHATWNEAFSAAGTDTKRLQTLRSRITAADDFEPGSDIWALPAPDFVEVTFPPQERLLGQWLLTRSIVMVHAPRGAGKTWFGLSVAIAVATGTSLLNWHADRPAKVLYVDGELPGALVQRRLQLLGGPHERLRIISPDLLDQRDQRMPNLGTPEGRNAFDAIIEDVNFDLVILDSISTLDRSGTENDASSWREIQDWAMRHRSKGRTIVFMHHEGRNNKPRGSSKREDVLDIMVGLKPMPNLADGTSSAFELRFTKYREIFGQDILTRILRLSTDQDKATWSSEPLPKSQFDEVQALKKEGLSQATIAKRLGVTPGRISQIVKRGAQ